MQKEMKNEYPDEYNTRKNRLKINWQNGVFYVKTKTKNQDEMKTNNNQPLCV